MAFKLELPWDAAKEELLKVQEYLLQNQSVYLTMQEAYEFWLYYSDQYAARFMIYPEDESRIEEYFEMYVSKGNLKIDEPDDKYYGY